VKITHEHFLENRQRILESAATRFRAMGFDGVGIADIMAGAGLTHGGFYSHFQSKAELEAAVFESVLANGGGSLYGENPEDPLQSLTMTLAPYLSTEHRANIGGGCLFASLGAEAARTESRARDVLSDALKTRVESLAGRLRETGSAEPSRDAMATMAGLIGTLLMARITTDPSFAEDILASGRERFTPYTAHEDGE
jgi:TetR/AcrR family transcriptional repressor of nem operon